jgi:hypothetical protein
MSTATEELKPTKAAADRHSLRVADTHVPEDEPYVLTSAETAECCCPDACERDHSNE